MHKIQPVESTKYGYSPIRIVENAKRTLYISGQQCLNERQEVMNHGDIEAQIRACFESIDKLLEDNGADLSNVVMLRAYVLNMRDHFDEYQKVLKEYFPGPHFPASTFIEVPRLSIEGALIEVDAIAAV